MKGKTVILALLVMSLALAQVRVDAKCCPTTYGATYCYNLSPGKCAIAPECQIVENDLMCPPLGNPVQVEAKKLCCPKTLTPKCNNISLETCAKIPECQIIVSNGCPPLGKSGAINEYCKLGCASSVCNAINTLQISGEEVVNEAVGQCYNACSAFCTKGSTGALEIA